MGILDTPGYSRAASDARFQLKYGAAEVALSTNLANAAANVTALNNAISAANTAGGGVVTVSLPGTYYIDDRILMRSNVTLRGASGVIIKKVAGATNNVCMIRNANLSTTRPYTEANMVIEGFTFDGNYAGNNTTLPGANKTPATINTLEYGVCGELSFIGVSNLTVRNVTIQNANGFAVQLTGDNLKVSDITLNTARDGIHLNGPSRGVQLRGIYGYTDDDFIAVNAWDWHRAGPAVGDIENLAIEDCTYLGTSGLRGTYGKGIKFLPGTRTTGAGAGTANIRNVTVKGFSILNSDCVAILSDFDQIAGNEYSGAGTVENVTFDTCFWRGAGANAVFKIYKDSNGAPADGQTSLKIRNVQLRNIEVDCATNGNGNAFHISYPYTGLSVNGLVFRDVAWTPRTPSGGGQLLNLQSKSPLDSIEVDGVTLLGTSLNNPVVLVNTYDGTSASQVKQLSLHRVQTANGATIDGPVLALNGIVDMLNARDWQITGSGASDNHGINFGNAVALLKNAVLANLNLTGVRELFRIGAGATGSLICKALVRDSTLAASVHPIFISGSRQADITFRGGNIDTPNNLARVDTSTLTLTLDGTTSSGTGANAITQVSTTTLRVPRSDRVALPLNTLTLTPSDGDQVYSSATPSSVVSGAGAGAYVYRGTGTTGWVKLN